MLAGDQPPSELLGWVAPRAPRLPSPLGSRGNSNDACSNPSPINAKFQHGVLNDAADQSGTVVMIGVGGGVSLPFLFFHAAPNDARRSPSQPSKF